MSTPSQNVRVRRQGGYCVALLLGIVAIVKLPPLLQVVGGVAVLVGGIGLLSEGAAFLRQIQNLRRTEQKERERRAKQEVRRERDADLKARREVERQTQAHAEIRRREAAAEVQLIEQRRREAEETARQARELAIQMQVGQLLMLDAEGFVEVVCAAFAGTAGRIEKGNRGGEFLYHRPDGTLEALWILTEKREATVADVEELEAYRRESNAAHAALVSRSGFAAEAVRLSAVFPITLTDPYLLAKKITL